jgi:predicted site-specific integrase-resolvase
MSKTAAIYARVSSDQQREQNTIGSQTQALLDYAQAHDYAVAPEWQFEDEGYSGITLMRPGLERLRDLIAEGAIQTVLIYEPDRLSRNYAYQVLLLEEFARHGAEVVFLKAPPADTPEQRLMLQFQGMIAEYERAQIAERCRRGKRHHPTYPPVTKLLPFESTAIPRPSSPESPPACRTHIRFPDPSYLATKMSEYPLLPALVTLVAPKEADPEKYPVT